MGILKALLENRITCGHVLSSLFVQKDRIEKRINACNDRIEKLDTILALIERAERRIS